MDDDFEEDIEPSWLLKERENALLTEKAFCENKKIIYVEGQQVGNFLFVHYNKYKNRATFECQECGRKFTSNIYSIKNKKRCKWYKFHSKKFKKV
ncbi:MAG: hypothetical protein GQ570_05055 [Helicobacteraceae bacterium]|nr:hypothetical protein [Helicobacteraceae bacterium]